MIRSLLVIACLAGPAAAHDWYDSACCSDIDCAPLPITSVTQGPDGWHVDIRKGDHPFASHDLRTVVPYGDERVLWSRDSNFHACLRRGPFDEMSLLCLYVPGEGA